MKISSLFLSVVTAFILLLGNKAFAAADIYFVHNDHLGTPQVLTNQEQNVVWQGDYKPFGEVDISVNNVELDARFPGQYQDSEAGVYYNYFRDYDPSLGRYIQSDPIGLEGGINTYVYVEQNPLLYVDPNGLLKSSSGSECKIVGKKLVCEEPPGSENLTCEQKTQRSFEQCKTNASTIRLGCSASVGLLSGAAGKSNSVKNTLGPAASGGLGFAGGGLGFSSFCAVAQDNFTNACESVRQDALDNCECKAP